MIDLDRVKTNIKIGDKIKVKDYTGKFRAVEVEQILENLIVTRTILNESKSKGWLESYSWAQLFTSMEEKRA